MLYLHRHRGIRVRDDNPFCFGSFEPLQFSHRFAVVFLFSQCGDAVLYLVAGFLYADSHLDVVHSIDLLFDANIVKLYCPQTIKAIKVSFLLFIDNKSWILLLRSEW